MELKFGAVILETKQFHLNPRKQCPLALVLFIHCVHISFSGGYYPAPSSRVTVMQNVDQTATVFVDYPASSYPSDEVLLKLFVISSSSKRTPLHYDYKSEGSFLVKNFSSFDPDYGVFHPCFLPASILLFQNTYST